MGIGDRLIDAVGEKSREVSEKITQKYRDHVGEELSRKQAELDTLKAELGVREKVIAECEAKIGKYYLIPKNVFTIS